MKNLCEVCKKREVSGYRNINDNPFVIPYTHVTGEDGRTTFKNKVVRNVCEHCYKKIEKTMSKLMGL